MTIIIAWAFSRKKREVRMGVLEYAKNPRTEPTACFFGKDASMEGRHMKKKKLGSMLLSMVMVLGMFPAIVFAEPNGTEDPGTFADLQAEIDAAPGTMTLSRNYVAGPDESCITIDNKNIKILLNGYTIDRNLGNATAPQEDGHVIKLVNGSVLTIEYAGKRDGTITGGYAFNGGGIYVSKDSTLIANNGTITGNRAGTDPDDAENSGCGGGIFFEGGAESPKSNRIFNTVISDNSASRYGGGVYNAASVMMQRGYQTYTEITGNRASVAGGGFYNTGSCTIGYGKIENNWAGSYGGGFYQEAAATLSMRSDHDIQTNTSGDNEKASNLFLATGAVISVAGSFSNLSTKIGISTENDAEAVITSGFGTNNPSITDAKTVFFSDLDTMSIDIENDEVVIKEPEAEEKIEFAFCSVTLDGRIGLNAYMDLSGMDPALLATGKMTFTVHGRGGNTQEVEFNENAWKIENGRKYYRFTCYLSSVQMADEIDAEFTYEGCSEPVVPEEGKTLSVKKYLQALSYTGTTDFERAFADYGFYVQTYLDAINNEWTVGDGEDNYAFMNLHYTGVYSSSQLTEIRTECGAEAYQPIKETEEGCQLETVKYKMELDYENAVIVTFIVADGAKLTASCEYNGKTFRAYKIADNTYRIRISGIYLQSMNERFVINGTCGSDFMVRVAPFGYIGAAVTTGSQEKSNAMAALYFLHKAAIAYCNQ